LFLVSCGWGQELGSPEAAALAERLRKSPEDPKLNYDLGLAYFLQKRLGEARPLLEKAAALTPKSQDVWMALSLTALGLKDYAGAANPLRHACELAKGESDACYLQGRTLLLLARYREAVAPLEKALRISAAADRSKVHRAMALNFEKLGDTVNAEREFHEAIRLYPAPPAVAEDPRLDFGAFLVRQGRAAEAIDPLRQALARSPLSAKANGELGRALLDLERPEEALPLLKKSVEIDPGAWAIQMLLGKAYLRLGRTADGERELRLGREGWAKADQGSSTIQ
jgi:Flp pilus assembly protein TadD